MSRAAGGHDRVSYADIFASAEFRALFVSRGLSTVGDYTARAALVVAVFTETGSEALMGVTFALTVLPDLLGGPLLAGLADRLPRRAVMVASDVGRALLVLVMAIPGMPLLALWALLFAIRLMDAPFYSSYLSTMSVVLPGNKLVKGTAVTQLVNHVSYTVGYALGGVMVALVGLSAVLVLNAATFTVSALIVLFGLVSRPATALPDSSSSWVGATRTAVRFIVGRTRLLIIMLLTTVIAATLACETLAAPYAVQIGYGPETAGMLMGAGPAGIVLGLWILPMLIPDQGPRHVLGLSVLSCAPLILFLLVPGPAVAIALIIVSGVALYYFIPLLAEFAQTVPDSMRGQALGLLTTMMKVTQGLAILIFGLVATTVPSSTVIAVSGAIGTAIAIVLSMWWVRTSRTTTAH
ncbi:MFS transporter [Actinomycetes bacterium KLBMP 9759]